jgi:hypothetical protein
VPCHALGVDRSERLAEGGGQESHHVLGQRAVVQDGVPQDAGLTRASGLTRG